MWCNQIFSLIHEDEIQNIIVADNYEVANLLARMQYGDDAYAVDTTQYPVSIGDRHINGIFIDENDMEIRKNPTSDEVLRYTSDRVEEMNIRQAESELDTDYRLSILELGL